MDIKPLDIWGSLWGEDVEVQDITSLDEGYVYVCGLLSLHQDEIRIDELTTLKERPSAASISLPYDDYEEAAR